MLSANLLFVKLNIWLA